MLITRPATLGSQSTVIPQQIARDTWKGKFSALNLSHGKEQRKTRVLYSQQTRCLVGFGTNGEAQPVKEQQMGRGGTQKKSLCSSCVGVGSFESLFNLPVPLPIPP